MLNFVHGSCFTENRMRKILYWLASTMIAVLAAGASEHEKMSGLIGSYETSLGTMPVHEPSRAVLLGIGIMAMAYTYQRAWQNMRRKD